MLRGFTDVTGVEWRVWDVLPTRGNSNQTSVATLSRSSLKDTAYADGWLCFEAGEQKRRLAPVPADWAYRDITMLEELCMLATPVPLRRHRTTGAA